MEPKSGHTYQAQVLDIGQYGVTVRVGRRRGFVHRHHVPRFDMGWIRDQLAGDRPVWVKVLYADDERVECSMKLVSQVHGRSVDDGDRGYEDYLRTRRPQSDGMREGLRDLLADLLVPPAGPSLPPGFDDFSVEVAPPDEQYWSAAAVKELVKTTVEREVRDAIRQLKAEQRRKRQKSSA